MLNLQKNKGFSLAEMMVVMLMLSIIFAAAAPILTKRATQTAEVKASTGSGVPVGTVIMWMSTTLPQGDEVEKWLECNGATFSATNYPDLKTVLGSTTLPNFVDRVPQGNATPKSLISAGLPNITASNTADWYCNNTSVGVIGNISTGAFYTADQTSGYKAMGATNGYINAKGALYFDASRANSIYGRSSTVQPPAITVKFLIKAKM